MLRGDIKMKTGEFRYRISSTEASSDKYGKCEVCGKHASEVFLQTEEQYYTIERNGETIHEGWTRHECNSYFGHEACLLSKRKNLKEGVA
jgi:hypothetical protein